jgi:hypothetical protein
MGKIYMLDYYSGVIAFSFNPAQKVDIVEQYRAGSGYIRLGVFSATLHDQVLFALANQHAIYEIDFTNQLKPTTIAKYSLMMNSTISSLCVNEEFIVVMTSANVTRFDNSTVWLNITNVFSRRTRSYLTAFQIFQHNTSNTFVDFERSTNRLLIITPYQLSVYSLHAPILRVYPTAIETLNSK